MSKKEKSNDFAAKVVKIIFLGVILIAPVYLGLSWFGASYQREIELQKEQSLKQTTVNNGNRAQNSLPAAEYSTIQEFVLEPGKKPVRIETGGKRFRWEHYYMGAEGKPVLLIRFIFKNGDISRWENIAGEHLKSHNLPDSRSIQAIEFGLPKEGIPSGLEVTVI